MYLKIRDRLGYMSNTSSNFEMTGILLEQELRNWICPYISRHLLSLNPLQARCRRYSRGER